MNVGKKLLNASAKSHKLSPYHGQVQQQSEQHSDIFEFNEAKEDHLSMFDFSSKEEFKLGEQFYEQRLRKLIEQLNELKQLQLNSDLGN